MTPEELNSVAWAEGCLWAFSEPQMRARFEAETGIDLTPPRSTMDALVDSATGKQASDLEAFVAWFNREIWGEDMVPDKASEKLTARSE